MEGQEEIKLKPVNSVDQTSEAQRNLLGFALILIDWNQEEKKSPLGVVDQKTEAKKVG